MTEKETKVIDAILLTMSRSFQRAVVYKTSSGLAWQESVYIEDALSTTREMLKILISGFDAEIDQFVQKLRADTRYKAPEQAGDLSFRFLEFREWLIRMKPKVVTPILVTTRQPDDLGEVESEG